MTVRGWVVIAAALLAAGVATVYVSLPRTRTVSTLGGPMIEKSPTNGSRPLDWAKLPAHLRYLAAPAEKYGHYQFDDRISEFLEKATDADRATLAALIPGLKRDDKDIHEFFRDYSITEHDESRLVYFLCHLIAIAHDDGFFDDRKEQK